MHLLSFFIIVIVLVIFIWYNKTVGIYINKNVLTFTQVKNGVVA